MARHMGVSERTPILPVGTQMAIIYVIVVLPQSTKRFDLVIGNPPYGIVFSLRDKVILEEKYFTFERNNDKYVAFTHRGAALLSQQGCLAFIVPNTFLLGPYFNALKKHLLAENHVAKIVDFGTNQVFADPNVFTALLFLRPRGLEREDQRDDSLFGRIEHLNSFPESLTFQKIPTDQLNTLKWMPTTKLLAKLATAKLKLGDVAWVKDVGLNYWTEGRGKKRGNSIGDRVLYDGQQRHKRDKPYLKGARHR